jgi:hypothetical protein
MCRQLGCPVSGTIAQLAAVLVNPEAHKRRPRKQRSAELAAALEVGDRDRAGSRPLMELNDDEQAELAAEIAATLEGRDSPWPWNEGEQGELVVGGLLLTAPERDFYAMQLRLLSGEAEAVRGSRPDFVGTKPAATDGALPWQSHEPLWVQSPTSVQEDWQHPWLSVSPPKQPQQPPLLQTHFSQDLKQKDLPQLAPQLIARSSSPTSEQPTIQLLARAPPASELAPPASERAPPASEHPMH